MLGVSLILCGLNLHEARVILECMLEVLNRTSTTDDLNDYFYNCRLRSTKCSTVTTKWNYTHV